MNIFKQLTYILIFSIVGQSISKFINILVPGSVIGLILFFLCLQFNILELKKVDATSKFLTENLAILFIPAGVGIMVNFYYIKDKWIPILLICLFSTILSLIVVGKITQYLLHRGDK